MIAHLVTSQNSKKQKTMAQGMCQNLVYKYEEQE
jgi:hypothetical protein